MRLLLLLPVALLLACTSESTERRSGTDAEDTVIYLSRHAEKAAGSDPALLPAGKDRAGRLAERLAGEGIAAVYATKFRRTRETARPTAERAGVKVSRYAAGGNPESLTRGWLRQHRGQRILVVGHSNTVPGLVNALLGEARYSDISEDDYSNLYRVSVTPDGVATVRELSSD